MAEAYSAVGWTTAELIADIKREGKFPDSELTNAEILSDATHVIWTSVQAMLVQGQAMSGWGLTYSDILASDAVGDGDEFILPGFSSAGGLLHVHWHDNASNDDDYRQLSWMALQQEYSYGMSNQTTGPAYFILEHGRVRVYPKPPTSSQGKLRVFYQARHPELVETSGNVIALYAHTAPTLNFAATLPANWPTSAASFALDIYSDYGPHRHYYRGLVATSWDAGAGTVTYTAANEDTVRLGDVPNSTSRVALAGQSDRVHLPIEMRKPLAQKAAANILRSQGDVEGANSLEAMYERAMAEVKTQLFPRLRGQPKRIINWNSPLRRGVRGSWFG